MGPIVGPIVGPIGGPIGGPIRRPIVGPIRGLSEYYPLMVHGGYGHFTIGINHHRHTSVTHQV